MTNPLLENLEPFDPSNPSDIATDAERRSFIEFFERRLRRAAKRGGGESATSQIIVGSLHAQVQFVFACHDGRPTEQARKALFDTLEFLWLSSEVGLLEKGGVQ